MPLIRDMRLWFFPKPKFKRPLRTIISPYDWQNVTEQQRLLMLAGVARSPGDANLLFRKYGVKTAREVLEKLPPRKKRSLKRRFILLMRRIEGHDPTNIFEVRPDNQISVRYRYKKSGD